jgi:hypothetical protein
MVEVAFAARLGQLGQPELLVASKNQEQHDDVSTQVSLKDQKVIAICKPVRDRDHLKFVAAQPCLVCGKTPSDAHHMHV